MSETSPAEAVNADPYSLDDPLSLEGRDYLTAAAGAAARTRNVTITLVALSVVMFIGMLNSLAHSWAGARILITRDADSEYVTANIGPAPDRDQFIDDDDAGYEKARAAYEERHRQFYAALMRSYVETGFAVRVPFFGVTIDVNDLGGIGGFAFLIVLIMFDFALRREQENINVALAYAFATRQLRALYDLLAMHQLFTTPRRHAHVSRPVLKILPKFMCFLPAVVQAAVVGHDIVTNLVGETLDPVHNRVLLACEIAWLTLMLPLTIWVAVQMIQIDRTWNDWADLRFGYLAVRIPEGAKRRSRWTTVPNAMKIHSSQLQSTMPLPA